MLKEIEIISREVEVKIEKDFEEKFQRLQRCGTDEDLFLAFICNRGTFSSYLGIPFTDTELEYIKVKLDMNKVKETGRNLDEISEEDLNAIDYPSLFSFELDESYKALI